MPKSNRVLAALFALGCSTAQGGTVNGSAGGTAISAQGGNGAGADSTAHGGNGAGGTAITAQGGNGAGGTAITAQGGVTAGAAGDGADADVRTIFYLDVAGRVLSFNEDQPTPRVLVSAAGQGPDGIAVDVAAGHVYWTTMGVPANDDGSVRRADLDGSHAITIVSEGGTYTPKQLKIDTGEGKLYWSDREGMRVQRASLDGSNLETLVTTGTSAADRKDAANWCVGLALDLRGGYFYWTQKGPDNGKVGSIRRAHLHMPTGENDRTRSDVEVLYSGLPEPVDLEVDASGGYMYWTDRGDDTINRAPLELPVGKSAATRADRQILIRGVREAIGVALDLERGQLYFTGGTAGRVGRAKLDGSDAMDFVSGNGAFTGITIVQLP